MKKIILIVILLLNLVGCEAAQVEVKETEYESPYVKDYMFQIQVMNEVYYNYQDVFAGFYLVNGVYNVNITEDAPEILIAKLTQNSLVTHHIVKYSYAQLWAVKELVFDTIINSDGFSSLSVSESNNSVNLTLITDTVVPDSFSHYIEIGILIITYQETHAITY